MIPFSRQCTVGVMQHFLEQVTACALDQTWTKNETKKNIVRHVHLKCSIKLTFFVVSLFLMPQT